MYWVSHGLPFGPGMSLDFSGKAKLLDAIFEIDSPQYGEEKRCSCYSPN